MKKERTKLWNNEIVKVLTKDGILKKGEGKGMKLRMGGWGLVLYDCLITIIYMISRWITQGHSTCI